MLLDDIEEIARDLAGTYFDKAQTNELDDDMTFLPALLLDTVQLVKVARAAQVVLAEAKASSEALNVLENELDWFSRDEEGPEFDEDGQAED